MAKKKRKRFSVEVVRQMITLSTSGFGLVAALAWNNLIQEFVNNYIKQWFKDSGLLTLGIYALIVTLLAVTITYELSRILDRLEHR